MMEIKQLKDLTESELMNISIIKSLILDDDSQSITKMILYISIFTSMTPNEVGSMLPDDFMELGNKILKEMNE